MSIQFKKAIKADAKLRMAIAGPSGTGKTYTSLAVGTALADGEGVALIDTEHGSAAKYADRFQFDVLELAAPFHPKRFVEAISAAADAGYRVLIIDSLSHAWMGPGGLLEIVDEIAARMKTSNTFAAWKDATPIQNALVQAIVSAPLHIIGTMRSKAEYVIESVERNGRTVSQPKKVGMAPVQREGLEFEFDVFGEMDQDNNLIVTKSRCFELAGRVIPKPGADMADTLRAWLTGITDPEVATALRTLVADAPKEFQMEVEARIDGGMGKDEARAYYRDVEKRLRTKAPKPEPATGEPALI